jgi:RNA polymerase sigma factor (sigma-70 family)
MNERNNTGFFDLDFYKKSLLFCKSYVKKTGGNDDEAKDLLQDSIEKFLNKLKDKDYQLHFKSNQYFYGVIKNTWKEKLRHKQKNPVEEFINDAHIDEVGIGIQKKLQTEKQIEVFDRCLKLLSPGCIKALKMQKKGFSLEKMTLILGLKNRGILQDRLSRCRQKLRILVNEDKAYIDLLNEG